MTERPVAPDEIQRIGFNESVSFQGRNLHIQTEVLVRDHVLVKTTILERGVVRFAQAATCSRALALHEIEAFVIAQHRRAVQRGASGDLERAHEG
jgi:hypothetical protein